MVKFNINFEQVRKAIQKLPIEQRIKLVEELERSTWEIRFRKMFARSDARRKKNPTSQKKINKMIEEAREDFYARTGR